MAHFEWENDAGHVVAVKFDAVRTVDHRQNAMATEHPVQGGSDIADHIRVELPSVSVTGYVSKAPLFTTAKIGARKDAGETSGTYEVIELPGAGVRQKGWVKKRIELPPAPPSPVRKSPTAALQGGIGGLVEAGANALIGAIVGPPAVDALVVSSDAGASSPSKVETLVTNEADQRVATMTSLLTEAQQAKRLVRFVDEAATYEDMVITHVSVSRTQQVYGAAFQVELKQIKMVASKFVDAPLPLEPRGMPMKNMGAVSAKLPDNNEAKRQERLISDGAALFDIGLSGAKTLFGG